jgi:purine-binding chemotaxis protein CheW
MESAQVEERTRCLVVRSGGHRCAIPVETAKLVSRVSEISPLPGAAPRLLGLAQIAGEPVAVVDLHALLDPQGSPGGGLEMTVIIRHPEGAATLALAVDEAYGVAEVDGWGSPNEDDPAWVIGRREVDGRIVVLLDPERLLADSTSVEEGAINAD